MCRAIFARFQPFAASASSCVSRMRTSANSAATKNPFSSTSTSTASTLSKITMAASRVMSQPSSFSFSSSSPKIFDYEDEREDEEESFSQFHLAKHHLQNVLQAHDARFGAVAGQHDGQPMAGALHQPQRNFQPHVFVDKQRGISCARRPAFESPDRRGTAAGRARAVRRCACGRRASPGPAGAITCARAPA